MARFSPLVSSVLGFDSFFDEIDRMLDIAASQTVNAGFPPLNLFKEPNGDYTIELAVAGFRKGDIQIAHDKKNSLLTISGNNSPRVEEPEPADEVPMTDLTVTSNPPILAKPAPARIPLKQGIASRRFLKSFTIADDLEVGGASLEDGMLTIKLNKIELPDSQPLLIAVK